MSNLALVRSENFGSVQCDFWENERKEILMTREQIGIALEYADPNGAIEVIHRRNRDRLDRFSTTVNLTGVEGTREVSREITVYTSKGIYEICRFSRQPKADDFMDWVWEVVESVRKHGAYMTPAVIEETLTNPDFIIQLATKLKEEQLARKEAENQLEQQAPLVGFAETCLASKDSILVRELAKIASKQGILIGQNRLYDKLRDWGLIMQGKTEPYQSAVNAGYFEVVQGGKETSKGNMIFKTTRVTTKGQSYIIDRLKNEKAS